MGGRIIDEGEGDKAWGADAGAVGGGADRVTSFPAPQRRRIAADDFLVFAIGDREKPADDGDRRDCERQRRKPGIAGAPSRERADDRCRHRADDE